MNELATVATFFKGGGAFMYVILGTGVLVLAIIVERFIVIGRARAVNGQKMIDDLVRCATMGDLGGARTISAKSNAPLARVARAMVEAAPGDEAHLLGAADGAATLVLPGLARRLPHLNMLANAATLLGLLGTIFGLITAFSAVGAADPAQRSAFLAAGISQALNTTAFGLIIAVPTLLVHGYLVGLVEGITEQIDEVSIRLSKALAAGGARPAGAVRAVAGANTQAPARVAVAAQHGAGR